MKKLLLLPLLFMSLSVDAQHYVRTKHNFGLIASYNFIDQTRLQKSFQGVEQGNSFLVGMTHEWKSCLYPELFFVQHSGTFPISAESPVAASAYKMNGIGGGMTVKIDLFSFDNKKKKGYCFGRILNLLVGAEYVYNMNLHPSNNFVKTGNEVNVKMGLGMYSVWGGSAKNHAAWTIHWEGYYNYGLTPFMTIRDFSASGNSTSFAHSSIGITLRVLYFKTYKFSEM